MIENETKYVVEVGVADSLRLDILNIIFTPLSIKLLDFVPMQSTVIDLGCGNGCMSLELAKRFDYVIAVDNSAEQLQIARKSAEQAKASNIEFLQTDVNSLRKLLSSKVDAIYCRFILMHLKNHIEVLQALKDCLKKGGYIIIEEPYTYSVTSSPHSIGIAHAIELHLAWSRRMGLDFEVGSRLAGYLKSAGFNIIHDKIVSPAPVKSFQKPEGDVIKLLHKNCKQQYIEAGFAISEMNRVEREIEKDMANELEIQPISIAQFVARK